MLDTSCADDLLNWLGEGFLLAHHVMLLPLEREGAGLNLDDGDFVDSNLASLASGWASVCYSLAISA